MLRLQSHFQTLQTPHPTWAEASVHAGHFKTNFSDSKCFLSSLAELLRVKYHQQP
jgi:hypothetical protein